MYDSNLKKALGVAIKKELKNKLGDSYSDLTVGFALQKEIFKNVEETSNLEVEHYFNDVDVKLAVERVLVDIVNDTLEYL